MGRAVIPVDLRNPGQVFACLGLMEAAEVLCGVCLGTFEYQGLETRTTFRLETEAKMNPVREVLRFLTRTTVRAVAPGGSDLAAKEPGVETLTRTDRAYPCPLPDTPSALPALLTDPEGRSILIEHWSDGAAGRDNIKFWAGAGGYSGAALTRDALALVSELGDNALSEAAADPFAVQAPQSSSFRFDWRRDYIPMDVGFSPNAHGTITMAGYPLVELLAAIGLQNARPERVTKLEYRYGVSNAELPTVLARAVLGTPTVSVFPSACSACVWAGQSKKIRPGAS